MADVTLPLSSTVASVFAAFVKKLTDEKALAPEAIEALRKALEDQELDPESLREALFTSNVAAHDPN
jgi:hypothetical protein